MKTVWVLIVKIKVIISVEWGTSVRIIAAGQLKKPRIVMSILH